MKKILFIITTFCFLTTAQGQQFSFKMFFSDAIGNKDTITLGYDLLASDSIDTSYGEVNLISIPLDTSLDVRITNEWGNRVFHNKPATLSTKKQIVSSNCSPFDFNHIQTIDILTRHWPVTATWDNSLFNDPCRNGSVFTSVHPGGWWDVGGYSNLSQRKLAVENSATFSSNKRPNSGDFYGYIQDHDTISTFWLAIADSSILYSSIVEISKAEYKLKVFPNPTSGIIRIQVPLKFGTVNRVEIFSSLGQLVKATKNVNDINFAQLDNGLYFIGVTNEKGERLWTRTIKE